MWYPIEKSLKVVLSYFLFSPPISSKQSCGTKICLKSTKSNGISLVREGMCGDAWVSHEMWSVVNTEHSLSYTLVHTHITLIINLFLYWWWVILISLPWKNQSKLPQIKLLLSWYELVRLGLVHHLNKEFIVKTIQIP